MFKDVMISFRTIGHKGDIVFATSRPLMPFKGMRLEASDDHHGLGTRILGIYVDGQLVTPKIPWWRRLLFRLRKQSFGIPTAAFQRGIMGNGLGLPQCPADCEIQFEIEFLADGQWKADLYGRSPQLS